MKKFISTILIFVIIFSVMTACGSTDPAPNTETTPPETTEPFDLDLYKSEVTSCVDQLYLNSAYLLLVANYELNYWESLNIMSSTVTADKLLSYAAEKFEEEKNISLESLSANYDALSLSYKDITDTHIEGTAAEEIRSEFKEYFELYVSIYNFAMSPSGDAETCREKFDGYLDSLSNTHDMMELLLG